MKLSLALCCILPSIACVSLPTPQEMLDTGFRTPEMTFHTFQMGVRADLPRLEFRCLSLELQGLSGGQLGYREFRERELQGQIAYWLGIPDAKISGSIPLGPDRHLLRAKSHGHEFEVEFVREFFWQVWHGDEHVVDEAIPPHELPNYLGLVEDPNGAIIVVAEAELPDSLIGDRTLGEVGEPISEFRVGSEWKISGFRDGAPPSPEPTQESAAGLGTEKVTAGQP